VAFSRRLLNDGEHVVVSTHTHVKALLAPAVWLIVLAGLAGYLSSYPAGKARTLLLLVIWVAALAAATWLVGRPFLRWLGTSYTITNRRLIVRTGILSRRGHEVPVPRVNDVSYEHGILDRILGCGTLIVSDASERGPLVLDDIPHVEQVHLELSDLLYHGDPAVRGVGGYEDDRWTDDGT
jgi:uncharacterized membrane protein YdbT with pleckstrin-like domain